ncbi:MAG TPA: GxxExxY protein [Gemmataceae bacterium]|nr:GxxExxY protein [Gemmataceae bacterium]
MNTDKNVGEKLGSKSTEGAMKHADITEKIIGAYYKVYNTLGYGFLEKVYQNAMVIELQRQGLRAIPSARIKVYYEGIEVGCYFADILVEDCVIVELKAVEALAKEHHAQILNYLKATGIEVGLLCNFGPKPEIKRKVFDKKEPASHPHSFDGAPLR